MAGDTVFGKIIRGELPADVVYRDEQTLAFRDIRPQAPVHILVIPIKPIDMVKNATEEDRLLLGHLLWVASRIAEKEGLADDGFRLVINNGENAGQEVPHLHVHVLGGRRMRWPPG